MPAVNPPPAPTNPVLPARGYFDLAEIFDPPINAYNSFSRTQILVKVQEKLKAVGLYRGTADGAMGPGTQQATISWQREHGIVVTGKLDYKTLDLLGLSGVQEAQPPPMIPSAKKLMHWGKGALQVELTSFTLQSEVQASVVVKVRNTSKDKVIKVGYDWLKPDVQYFSIATPQGSDLFTAAGAQLKCLSSTGIQTAVFPANYSIYDGIFGGPREIIDGMTDINPQESVTFSIEYGLNQKANGGHPPGRQARPDDVHHVVISFWYSEVLSRGFSKPVRATVQFENIPQTP